MSADQWITHGDELSKQRKYPEAEEAYRLAAEMSQHDARVWYILGRALDEQEKYIEAEEAYRHVLDIDAQDLSAWHSLGFALSNQDRHADAEEAHRHALDIDPNDTEIWSELGYVLNDQEKYVEAVEAFRRALDIDSEDLAAWYGVCEALFNQGKHSEFAEAVRCLLNIDKSDALLWADLGTSLFIQDRYIEAEEAYRRAIDIGLNDAEIWSNLGAALKNQRKYVEAEDAYRRALDIDRNHAEIWSNLGAALKNQEKHVEAEDAYRRALDIDPRDATAWYSLGYALGEQEKHVEAEEAYRRVLDIDSRYAAALNNLGVALSNQGKHVESEDAYRRALDIDPRNATAWCSLGHALGEQEKHVEAEEACRRALDIDPRDATAWYRLGISLNSQDNFVEGEKALLRATCLGPENARAWVNLGFVLENQYDRDDEAEHAFQKAICLDPGEAWAWYFLGCARLRQDKIVEAEKALLKATELDPENETIWMGLGDALTVQDDYVRAEEAYLRATRLKPDDASAWTQLGLARLRQSRWADAEKAANRAVKLSDKSISDEVAWFLIAICAQYQGKSHSYILKAYKRMARASEGSRRSSPRWDDRLLASHSTAASLQEAAAFCLDASSEYEGESLKFAVQSKARTLGELLAYDTARFRGFLAPEEQERLDTLGQAYAALDMKLQGWGRVPELSYQSTGPTTRPLRTFRSSELKQEWRAQKKELDQQREIFFRNVIVNNPERDAFVNGPQAIGFSFSLARLRRRLKPGEAVLELLLTRTHHKPFLGFLITQDGLIHSTQLSMNEALSGEDSLTVKQWQQEVISTLHIGQVKRADGIKNELTEDVLYRWGELLYGPFIDDLKGIRRLWVSPHSFVTQLPFNAIPFPDAVEREVAVIPSAASLLQPKRRGPRPKPRFTLGAVAADSIGSHLDLNGEEARHLRGSVRSARRRWELAGNRTGEEPTLANLQERAGLTRCLVLSCHGEGPNEDWGTLHLGTRDMPEPVTGRQLVDSLLLGGRLRDMEVDLVVTSACLTGQVDLDHPEEWLGLPVALQSVWNTKAMLLTLWEVEPLPAMIWVVELVKALTQGLSVGEAHMLAQEKVRTVTREQVKALWLSKAKDRLPPERWDRVDVSWQETTRTTGQHPFADPVHWAPFVLVGDPRVTISPRR